ncbi:MAG: hypothetical protein GY865_19655 [candidate division Zixibacteria bacterium]|nr:hypothetical protein [candidate division Zixibacteria bacterium]
MRQLELSKMSTPTPQWVYIEDIIEIAIEEILFNDAPLAETLLEANKKIQELIKTK